MSNEELEVYVALVAKFMQLSPEQRDLISGELQDHLQLRVEDLIDEGVSRSDAISQAVEEFGDAAVMAKNFQTVHNLKRRRWMMRFMTFSIAGSFLFAVLTMAMWPQDARFGSPSKSIAQEKDASEAPAPESQSTASTSTQLTERTETTLKRFVTFDLNEVAWTDVKEQLESQHKLNIILTTSALDDALSVDETFTSTINGVPLGKALDLVLAPKNATYVIDSGVIQIISLDEANDEKWHRVKMFDCRELVNVLPKTAPPIRLLREGYPGGRSGGGQFAIAPPVSLQGFGSGGASQTKQQAKKQDKEKKPSSESKLLDAKLESILLLLEKEAIRQRPEPSSEYTLKNLIESMVYPETWHPKFGDAKIDVINGIAVARNSEGGLKRIADLIADLEDKMLPKKAQQPPVRSEQLPVPIRQPKASAKQLPTPVKQAPESGNDNPFGDTPVGKPTTEDGDPFKK